MRANLTRQESTNTTMQLGEGTYESTKKLTTMSNFNSLGHRNRGKRNRTVSTDMRSGDLFTEQPMSS